MRRLRLIMLLIAALLLAGCGENGIAGVTLVTEGDHAFGPGETLRGALVISGGATTIPASARVLGPIYLLDGRLDLDGAVRGDVTILGGALRLGPAAVIDGTLNVGGGALDRSPTATIAGGENRGMGVALPDVRPATLSSLVSRAGWALANALALALLAALTAQFLPRPVSRVGMAATRYPLVAGALGLLAGVVVPALLVLMAFTLVLIPVAILGAALLALTAIYGWLAIGAALGRWLFARLNRRVSRAAAAATGTLLLTLALNVINLVPLVGPLALLAAVVTGFGAAMLTRFGLRSYAPPDDRAWQADWSRADWEHRPA